VTPKREGDASVRDALVRVLRASVAADPADALESLRRDAPDWPAVVEKARALGLSAPVARVASSLGPTSVPPDVLAGLAADARSVEAAPETAEQPSAEDELVLASVEFEALSDDAALVPLVAIADLLRADPPLDWGRVVESALRSDATTAVEAAMAAAREVLGAEVPEDASRASVPTSAETASAEESAAEERDQALRGKFNRSVAWNTASKISTRGMQFVVTIVLARLLTPAIFGLCGMASMVTMFTMMIVEFGFAHALVQKLDISDADICTGMSISVLLGAGMTALCVLGAPAISALFRTPELTAPLRVISFDIVLGSLAIAPRALLYRRFDFRSVTMADFAAATSYGTVAIVLAALHWGIWSIVFGTLAMSAFQVAALWLRAGYRFRPMLVRSSAAALMPFGGRVFASNIADFLRGNLDYFVVGRMLGPASLGMYTIAFKIADFPRSRLASIITDVALPAMSEVQKDGEVLKRTYRRAVSLSALFTFPLLVGMTVLAPQFVSGVYGPKWLAAVPALEILMPMGLLLAVCQPGSTILLATGKPGSFFRLSVVYAVCVGLFAFAGVRLGGITGVALGVMAATLVYFAGFQWEVWRLVGIGPTETARALAVPAFGSTLMVGALLGYRAVVPFAGDVRGLLWLAGAGVLGGLVYAVSALPLSGIRLPARFPAKRRQAEEQSPIVDEVTTG
jgi:O-antigen/teichoic acid export membrane protein